MTTVGFYKRFHLLMILRFRCYTKWNFKNSTKRIIKTQGKKIEVQALSSQYCSYHYTLSETWSDKSFAIVRQEKLEDKLTVESLINDINLHYCLLEFPIFKKNFSSIF